MTRWRAAVVLATLLMSCARGGRDVTPPAPSTADLHSVWSLYLETLRASSESEYAADLLRSQLQGQRRFVLVGSPELAQAIVRVNIAFQRPAVTTRESPLIDERTAKPMLARPPAPVGSITLVSPASPNEVVWSSAYTPSRLDRVKRGGTAEPVARPRDSSATERSLDGGGITH